MREDRIRWRGTEVKKKRAGRSQNTMNLGGPCSTPFQIGLSILPVGIFPVTNAKIVRRRSHHKIDMFARQFCHSLHAILAVQSESGHGMNLSHAGKLVQQKAAPANK